MKKMMCPKRRRDSILAEYSDKMNTKWGQFPEITSQKLQISSSLYTSTERKVPQVLVNQHTIKGISFIDVLIDVFRKILSRSR